MSIFSDPPRTTKTSFRHGDVHLGVWALQRFLNKVYPDAQPKLVEDGVFGPALDGAVRHYQQDTGASVDGIVGPQTSLRIVRSCVVRAPNGTKIPKGLVEGQIDGESGRQIAAVNAQVAGGLDLGLTQRRAYGPPFDEDKVKAAMDPIASVAESATDIYERYLKFAQAPGLHGKSQEYVWRICMLAHNWPWAADQLSKGIALSTTKRATWVPANVKFPDGTPVVSYADWAAYYAMGSHKHNHKGLVTGMAFGVPSWG